MKSFNLISHCLKNLSFNLCTMPELLFHGNDTSVRTETGIDIQVSDTDDKLHEVEVHLQLHSVLNEDSETLFSISINYAGIVQIEHTNNDEADNEEIKKETLMIDVPQFLFPYISSLVLQILNTNGFSPCLIPQIDFQQMYEQKKEQKPIDFFNL